MALPASRARREEHDPRPAAIACAVGGQIRRDSREIASRGVDYSDSCVKLAAGKVMSLGREQTVIQRKETAKLFVRQRLADAITLASLSAGRGDSRTYAV